MRRIIKSSSRAETGWDQALALYREQLRCYLGYLIQCGCGEGILANVEAEVKDSFVSDNFKLRYLVRTLVRNVFRHMRESDHTAENSRFLHSDFPNGVLAIPSQERMVYFLRDVLEYSKRDASLLIGITDAQADNLLSLARKRIDITGEPSSIEIESSPSMYFRMKFTDINFR
jgi:hypothetical protein